MGNPEVNYALGMMYENGQGGDKDLKGAARNFYWAARQGHKEALERLQAIAEQGYADAPYDLGWMYYNAKAFPKMIQKQPNGSRKPLNRGMHMPV